MVTVEMERSGFEIDFGGRMNLKVDDKEMRKEIKNDFRFLPLKFGKAGEIFPDIEHIRQEVGGRPEASILPC